MRGLSCSPQRSKTPAMQSMHNLPKFIIVKRHNREVQTTPLIAGMAVGAAAYAARTALVAFQGFKAAGPRMKQFYKGGFLPEMNRREASQILGIRESAPDEKIKEAHRRIMIANHPDAGGSSFIAAKVNEAKDILMGKKKNGSSIF
ncbi:putative Mitochondrial import inner membrane translocase subunit TIM14-1 [Nannochloris sp. 'desiccata']|nr:putative Mitochondrial import inner membrane translocase subunit TIM14-1 [Chlorella desiccata (nom. nud.)]